MSKTKLYPFILEPVTTSQGILKKKMKDVNSFNKSVNDLKETKAYFENRRKSETKYKKHKLIIVVLKSFDAFVIIATTITSVTLSVTRTGLILTPKQTAVAFGVVISKKLKFEIVMQK